ncbi:NAD(P)H oxidoreductase [Mangrovibacillus sp. Mu-81]|uniref:NAD(P)H oxidoreductase n=1 Tax=Mangrovibacillus sp. Mu-81 TaxID=3121478 RepID=UPI002FE46358
MKVLIILSHPRTNSLTFSIARHFQEGLQEKGHKATVLDLYREEFDPVLKEKDEPGWGNRIKTRATHVVENERKRLKRYDACVFIFPIWWYGLPAILKGYIDRVFFYPSPTKFRADKVLWLGLAGDTEEEFTSGGHDNALKHQLIHGISKKMGTMNTEVRFIFDTKNEDNKFDYEKTMDKAYQFGLSF